MTTGDWTPQGALAEGLAEHVRAWALELGADEADARAAGEAAAAASRATAAGHVCVELGSLAPDAAPLRQSLLASRVVGQPGRTGSLPLVLDADDRLYLQRYYDYERRLAVRVVRAAREGRLAIVSGGPGTGKTTRIVSELAALLEQSPDLRIALAAPTGKAAARMTEALRGRAGDLPAGIRDRLPSESFTLHRLLRHNPSRGFEHGADNPLPIDVLVVDEASMLDLALATRVLEAVPPGARILLLGDQDQLAAVESGAVFAELSAERERLPVTLLTKNWRFPEDSGIGRLATELRRGDAESALVWLRANADPAVRWEPQAAPLALALQGFAAYLDEVRRDATDVAAMSAAFARFRVLCAVREGPQGVEALNRELSAHARATLGSEGPGDWYVGRPVMVQVNDYALRLFNGDVGLALPDARGELMVWFPEGQGWRPVAPARVPRHETAWAMTVHKAQGSEFDQVMLVLPRAAARVATRELVYTGITRARQAVVLAAGEAALAAAVRERAVRHGGLRSRIREAFEAG
ncbi:exodeoxyribonuclease V subunit alpha [Ramlibacter humi]|uniref:exodeoxyribonuclease V subunit alpha n=1 Tax=Ramlibacter humi TaxID=2530451 RepID=UPI001EEFA9AC|nr:exodeoxyribonuclease V subunit alpha [Ramlibacter humi]